MIQIFLDYIIGLFYSLFSKKVRVIPFSRIDSKSSFEGKNYIGRKSIVLCTKLGRYSYMGSNCVFTNSKIGRFCSISSNVKIITGKHPSSVFVSTHPVFYSANHPTGNTFVKENLFEEFERTANGKDIEIGNDVWIGRNVLLMGGISIGDGAIIAAGSIVTKDVEPFTIVAGIPAKVVRRRFNDEDCCKLQNIKWWEWDDEKLKKNSCLFSDIDSFLLSQKSF